MRRAQLSNKSSIFLASFLPRISHKKRPVRRPREASGSLTRRPNGTLICPRQNHNQSPSHKGAANIELFIKVAQTETSKIVKYSGKEIAQ